MEITEREVDGVTILDLKGTMTLGEGDDELKDKVRSLIGQGKMAIVFNMGGTPYIDSAGLSEVVRSYTTISRFGGTIKLLAISKRVEDLLVTTKLLAVFDIFEDEVSAVQSFKE